MIVDHQLMVNLHSEMYMYVVCVCVYVGGCVGDGWKPQAGNIQHWTSMELP